MPTNQLAVFTKPWKTKPINELGAFVAGLGFDAVELPVRPGFQVVPDRIAEDLPVAARQLGEHGVSIASVAGTTDVATIAACGTVGVPIIRVCLTVPKGMDYLTYESQVKREYDALLPELERHNVAIGVQNHSGRCIANAMGMRHLLHGYDPRYVCAVWDPAHCALQGEIPELAADIVWSHLRMVNLKNAIWQRTNGPEAEIARYKHYWTSGRQGLCPWPEVVRIVRERGFDGPICLPAEYSDEEEVARLIAEDVLFAKDLLGQA
jgi:sugar phosphate isomerase/epimerase